MILAQEIKSPTKLLQGALNMLKFCLLNGAFPKKQLQNRTTFIPLAQRHLKSYKLGGFKIRFGTFLVDVICPGI